MEPQNRSIPASVENYAPSVGRDEGPAQSVPSWGYGCLLIQPGLWLSGNPILFRSVLHPANRALDMTWLFAVIPGRGNV